MCKFELVEEKSFESRGFKKYRLRMTGWGSADADEEASLTRPLEKREQLHEKVSTRSEE